MNSPPESGSLVARRPGDDDLIFDVAGFVLLLWRSRLVLLILTVAGGAMGLAYARSLPPRFVGTSLLTLTLAPGTEPAVAQVARFQALAGDLTIIESVLKDAGLRELSPAAVREAMTTRVGPSGTVIIVETQWPDAETAGRLSSGVAGHALDALRQRLGKDTAENLAARQKELAVASEQVRRAYLALAESWIKNRPATFRPAVSGTDFDALGRELEKTLAQIPLVQARIKVAKSWLANISPTALAADSIGVRNMVIDAEMRLAELVTQRDLFLSSVSSRPPEEILSAWSKFDAQQGRLEGELRDARQKADQLVLVVSQARENMSQSVGIELIEPSFSPGRSIGLAPIAFVARGMASGFLLAVFGVFFVRGMLTNLFGRPV